MQTKFHSVCIVTALLLWFATIGVGIFFQQEFLKWVTITPFHMVLTAALMIFLCVMIVVLFQGFKQCQETKNCKHAFRGLSDARIKKRNK